MREPPESASVSNGTPLPPGEKRRGTKLEKTSLSAGGFLRVPYGYRSRLRRPSYIPFKGITVNVNRNHIFYCPHKSAAALLT